MAAADEARAAAFAVADPAPLRDSFSDPAIRALAPQLERLRRRGQRIEVRGATRQLVHWRGAPGRCEGAVEVTAEQRLVSSSRARPWARVARQWQATLAWSGGRWLVIESSELSPERWWRA